MIPLQLVANLCQSTAPHGMHLPITQIITLNPEMHSITGNIDVAVQDQPIADLSAHALILKPRSLRILNAWEALDVSRETRIRQLFLEGFWRDVSSETRIRQLFLEGFWRDVSSETRIWQLFCAQVGGRTTRYELKELSKAMFFGYCWKRQQSCPHLNCHAQCLGSSSCLGGLAEEQKRLEGKKS